MPDLIDDEDDPSAPSKEEDRSLSQSRELLNTDSTNSSQIMSIQIAINPLVASAGALLSIVTLLRHQTDSPDFKQLHDTLFQEVKAFEAKALKLGYRSQLILGARFFICSLIDETIEHASFAHKHRWRKYSLLNTFQNEAKGDDRFFLILQRAGEDPSFYIDLLELGYICLSLGFQGRYRHLDNGYYELGLVIDHLYDLIRYQRGEISRRLLIAESDSNMKPKKIRSIPWLVIYLLIAIIIIIAGVGLFYRHRLHQVASKLNQHIEVLHKVNPSTSE